MGPAMEKFLAVRKEINSTDFKDAYERIRYIMKKVNGFTHEELADIAAYLMTNKLN